MFRIGEFSKLVRVSPRMLRHYEKCGLLYPAEIHRETGYRWYSASQIALLQRIVWLRDTGFSIDEIGDMLPRFDDGSYIAEALSRRENEIMRAIGTERGKLERLERIRDMMKKENAGMNHEVIVKDIPAIKVLSLREKLSTYADEGKLWHKLGEFMAKNDIQCPESEESGYSIYWDDDFKENDVDVEIAVPVEKPGESRDGFVFRELAGIGLAATLRFDGPYDGYTAAMEKLGKWMEQNGYSFAGSVRGAAIRTPQDQANPENYLTELQVPVMKK